MFCTECGARNFEGFKFCSSCGKSRSVNAEIAEPLTSNNDETVELVIRPKGVVLGLEDGKWDLDLCNIYKNMIGAKDFGNIIFDAILTSKRVLIRPVSKAPANLWVVGALISPAFAQTADLMGRRISSFLASPTESIIGKSIESDVLISLPFWGAQTVAEVKQSLPSLWKNAGTIMSFEDTVKFGATAHKSRLSLVFDGSATASKKQFNEFPALAKICKFDVSRIANF